jgi:hypothetical protein
VQPLPRSGFARKIVDKWMRKARRRLEQRMAAGMLDLPPPPGAIALAGMDIEPEAPETPRQSVERVVRMCSEMLNEVGEVPAMFVILDYEVAVA